jgi:hypothetical protein
MTRGGAAAETAGFFCFGFFFSGRRASLFPMPTRCHRSPNLASASVVGSFNLGSFFGFFQVNYF